MSRNYRFVLEPYNGPKSRYRCPSCQKPKVFTRYIDLGNSKEYIDAIVGRCDRAGKCKYHYTPSEYFKKKNLFIPKKTNIIPLKKESKNTSFIPDRYVKESLKINADNYFLNYLNSFMSEEIIKEMRNKYCVGTSKKWRGATIFWQIDDKAKSENW